MDSPRRHRTPVFAVLAAALVVLVSPVWAAGPAHAHDELLSSDPTAGSTVEQAPSEITMTFSGELIDQPGATTVEVTDAQGASVTDGEPAISGAVLTQPITTAGGVVSVVWRVVSSDGHPISGEFAFTVDDATPVPPATPTETPTATATPTAEPPATDAPTPTETPDAEPAASGGTVAWIVVGVVVLAVAGVLIGVAVTRSRRGGDGLDRP